MGEHGPTIPTAIMVTAQGRVEVHPAAEDWYAKVEALRYASQRGQLFCPDCNERLKYYSEVRTPHFRHLRDTQGCTNEERYPERANLRREKWFRNSLVAALRQTFPPGARFLADDYLGNLTPFFVVQLPSGKSLILNVVTEKPDMQVWERRRLEFETMGMPIFHVFGRGRVKAAIRQAAIGRTPIVIDDGLNADHQDAARSLLVDMAHAAREAFYELPLLQKAPETLYFFEPPDSPMAPGTLTILRGLMPSATDTVYHGVAVKAETIGQGVERLRFSLRHGFYTTDDVEQMVWLRDGWRRRRKRGPTHLPTPAATRKHPLRIRVEQARMQAEAEARRAQEQKRQAEMLAVRRVASERESELERQGKQIYENLLRLLPLEGAKVLSGRIFPVPHPDAFKVPPAECQAAVLGFAYRAHVSFWDNEAADWLWWRGYTVRRDAKIAQANMQKFWRGVEAAGLVTIIANHWGDFRITPAGVPGSFQWPVKFGKDVERAPALCVICAAGYDQPFYRLTDTWRYHDPVNRLCLCSKHNA